ncbi:MAG: tetratricopeptide repeat protein [bacterium]
MSVPAHRIIVIGALAVSLAGCSAFRRHSDAGEPGDMIELGASEMRIEPEPADAGAYGAFLVGTIALQSGDQEAATTAFEQAVAADPRAAILRQRLAALYVRQGKLAEALEQSQAAVVIDPDDVDSRLMLADVLSTLGRDAEATREYEGVLALDPDQEQARLLLGVLYAKRGEIGKAESTLKYLTERDPSSFLGYYYLGRVYAAAQDFKRAEQAYRTSLKINPTAEPVLIDLALLYEATQRPEQAIALYEQVLKSNPRRVQIRRRLGALYARQRKYDDALEQFRALEDGDTDQQETRTKIGLILLETGEYDRAANEFSLVLGAEPDNAKVRYYLASAYEQSGDTDRALTEYRKVPADHEWFVDSQRMIVHLLQQKGDAAGAAAALAQAREQRPDEEDLIDVQAGLLREQGNLPEAIKLMQGLVAAHPDNDRYHFTLGAYYDEAKERAKCVEQMELAIQLNADNAPALNYLGYTYAEQGTRLDEAEALIRRALAISPHDGFYVDSLGWVYYQRGDYDAAIEQLEHAVALANDDPTIAEHLGDAYLKAGRGDDALRIYRDALSRSTEAGQAERLRGKIDELQRSGMR